MPRSSMNICQLITPSRIAGAERSTASLCEHLQAAGHRIVIGVREQSGLIGVMREMGLDARALPIGGKLNPLAWIRVAALARSIQAGVIHSHLSTAALHATLSARLIGVPSVVHVRALNDAFWFRKATRAIAVSRAVKDHLVHQGMSPERIDVVYNGVDPARYFLPCTREEAKNRLGLPPGAVLAGVVGHMTPRKGHTVLLDAFATLASRHPEAYLLFLGQGDNQDELEEQTRKLHLEGRVIFSGFHPDVLPFYAAFDVVVLPSVSGEGLPRALLEGGLLGRAAVGTRLSGVPEIIQDGETGFVVPPSDAPALAERLDILLSDAALRERMGQRAKEWIADTFTIRAMVEGVLASYGRAGARV